MVGLTWVVGAVGGHIVTVWGKLGTCAALAALSAGHALQVARCGTGSQVPVGP